MGEGRIMQERLSRATQEAQAEGRGEGEKYELLSIFPLTLTLSPEGRGDVWKTVASCASNYFDFLLSAQLPYSFVFPNPH